MSRQPQGMMFVDSSNMIVLEALRGRILEGKREPCEISCSDFDDVAFKLSAPVEAPNEITLSMSIRSIDDLRRNGANEALELLFPGMEIPAESGYSVSLRLNLDAVSDPEAMLIKMAELKKHVLGAPIEKAFAALAVGRSNSLPLVSIDYRPGESIYVCPGSDKVTVIFLVAFSDDTDRAVARVFLQEFVDVQRTVSNAPPCSYSKERPLELRDVNVRMPPNAVGFISFAFENRHVTGDRKDKAVALLTGFRTYLLYHIKASKTYLHMRMRKRVNTWLQVLNRAVPEQESEKKTATGKSFKRK